MPLARIALPAGKLADFGRAVADVVCEAMIATLNAPKNDRFQGISEHARNPDHRSDLSRHRTQRRRADHPAHPQRRSHGRGQEGLLQGGRRWAARTRRAQARGCLHQSRRGEEGELVLRQRHRAVRLNARSTKKFKRPQNRVASARWVARSYGAQCGRGMVLPSTRMLPSVKKTAPSGPLFER